MRTSLLASLMVALMVGGCHTLDSASPDETGAALDGCGDPQEITLVDGSASGYVRCGDGSVNRDAAVAVDPSLYIDAVPACSVASHGGSTCETDEDCGGGAWTRCADDLWSGGAVTCSCVTLCSDDADCEPGFACVAPEPAEGLAWPVCKPANCASGDDCASGECGLFSEPHGCYVDSGLACRTESDACRGDADCGDEDEWTCALVGAPDPGAWSCESWMPCD